MVRNPEVPGYSQRGGKVFYVEVLEFGRIKIGGSWTLFTLRTTESKRYKSKIPCFKAGFLDKKQIA